jgi:hypothetical protein
MICPVPVEVQEVAVAALEAAPAEEDLAAEASVAVRAPEAALEVRVPEALELPIITRIITITVPILVGALVRAVITAVAEEDASAR